MEHDSREGGDDRCALEEEWGAVVTQDRACSGGEVREIVESAPAEAVEEMDGKDEYSLGHEFYDSFKAWREHVKSNGEDGPMEKEVLGKLVARLKAIALRVGQLRLFSPNEELDDVNTTDLKFLLVPCLLADALAVTREVDERPQALRHALVCWRGFAADCNRLGVAHRDDWREIDGEVQGDAHACRDRKIDRYRRGKELDEQVGHLFRRKREAMGDEFQWGSAGAFDEDLERELVLALLGRCVASAVDEIRSAEQELPLLEMMIARGGPGNAPKPPPRDPADTPFIVKLQDKAECMRLYKEMVFQKPFADPTMTLAEYADIEMEQVREQQESKASAEMEKFAYEDDRWWGGDRQGRREDEEGDQKTYKDRDWDNWKDEHPWGSGNKMANVS